MVELKHLVDKREETSRERLKHSIADTSGTNTPWESPAELVWECVGGISCMFVDLDIVYAGCGDGHIYAIDSASGMVISV